MRILENQLFKIIGSTYSRAGLTKALPIIFLALAMAIVSFAPAVASDAYSTTVRVQIDNRTNDEIDIQLNGPASYSLTVQPGKSKFDLERGTYSFTYRACNNKNFKGTFEALSSGDTLKLAHCHGGDGGPGMTGNPFILIENKTADTVSVYLTGPNNYTFRIAPGTVRVEVTAGKYSFSYTACGIPVKGTIQTKTSRVLLSIPKCQAKRQGGGSAGEEDKPTDDKTLTLVIVNMTNEKLTFTLRGPHTYTLTVPKWTTKYQIVPGIYTWRLKSNSCSGYNIDAGTLDARQPVVWYWYCDYQQQR